MLRDQPHVSASAISFRSPWSMLILGMIRKNDVAGWIGCPGQVLHPKRAAELPVPGDQAHCWGLPSLEPVRSAFGPVFGVYFVSLVAVLCFVQSKLSVSSWVKRQMLPSSNPQWNSPVNAENEQKFSSWNYSSHATLSKYLSIIANTLWDDAY